MSTSKFSKLHRFFTLSPPECEEADYTIRESPDTYDKFWRVLYESEYVPKFLVSDWLRASTLRDARYVGGFLLTPNLWHAEGGPGEHAGVQGIHRWIAWHVPPHLHRILEATLGKGSIDGDVLTCLSHQVDYTYDSTQSDLPMRSHPDERVLHTVRDLTIEDQPALYELQKKVEELFRTRFGVGMQDLAIYAHYPVRSRLALLHFHISLGHKETGTLAARSHELQRIMTKLTETGTYNDPSDFEKYHLNSKRDGSMRHILEATGKNGAKGNEHKLDVVIPCGPLDTELLSLCVSSLRRCCHQINRIVVISPSRVKMDGPIEWFDEALFPFQKEEFGSSWRYQQALKLCSPFVIPKLLDNVLVVDADTVWYKRHLTFFRPDGAALYTSSTASKDVAGYNAFFERVLKPLGLGRLRKGQSGITHHMVFQRDILARLFTEVRACFGKPIWKVFAEGKPSEWELYYHFAFIRFPGRVALRQLRFVVTGEIPKPAAASKAGIDFVACHYHRRHGYVDTHDDGMYHMPVEKALRKGQDAKDHR